MSSAGERLLPDRAGRRSLGAATAREDAAARTKNRVRRPWSTRSTRTHLWSRRPGDQAHPSRDDRVGPAGAGRCARGRAGVFTSAIISMASSNATLMWRSSFETGRSPSPT